MSTFPIAKRELTKVKLGFVDGEQRGDDLMNPPKELDDYYYWLRDDDRKNKDVLDYLNTENTFTKSVMDKHQTNVDNMFNEIKSHINENYETHPYPQGKGEWNSKYRYFVRTIEGLSYPIYCRINIESGEKQVLLDVNKLAKDKSYCDVSGFNVSYDHNYISYGIDGIGDEKYKLILQIEYIKYGNMIL